MKAPTAVLLASLCGVAPALCAQQTAPPTVSLTAISKVEMPVSRPTVTIGRAACDGVGNVYTRQLDAEASKEKLNLRKLPIREIAPAGNVTGNFKITDAALEEVVGRGVFVSRDRRIYQAALARGDVYVVEFAQNGSIVAKTRLEVTRGSVMPWHLAVFDSGEFLLVGETGKDGRDPYTAVFAADGRLLKSIYEPEDEEARRRAEAGESEYAPPNVGNRFVSFGDVAAGSDGDVYLLRGTSPALVYVISPKAGVVRKLRIDVGDPNLTARSIKSYAGRLAVQFDGSTGSDQYLVKVIDTRGNLIGDYGVGGIEVNPLVLACYDSEGLTMISEAAHSKLYLVKAKLP